MKVLKNEQSVMIVVSCTRDEISDAIAVLEALHKDMPVDNRPRFPKAQPVEMFLANIRRSGIPTRMNVEF